MQPRKPSQKNASQEYLRELRDEVRQQTEAHKIHQITEGRRQTSRRLQSELNALTRRGNLNLVLGVITAVGGISLLAIYVLSTDFIGPVSANDGQLIARVSLTVIIEIFAYFFLRLYSTSLSEIKYFQNEMTNIESKHLALEVASMIGDEGLVKDVVRTVANTERNFILAKGQTTASVERAKLDSDSAGNFARAIVDLANKHTPK